MGFSMRCWTKVGSVSIARGERQPEGICAGAAHCMLLPGVIERSERVIVEEKHPEGISAGSDQRVRSLSFELT